MLWQRNNLGSFRWQKRRAERASPMPAFDPNRPSTSSRSCDAAIASPLRELISCSSQRRRGDRLMMRRREFIALVSGAMAWPAFARAQTANRVPRLCFLTFDPGTRESNRFKPFFQRLRELSYVDGQNINID